MDQTSVTNNKNEEEEPQDLGSIFVSAHSGSGRNVPDDCHSTLSDDVSVDWTKLITEEAQIAFFLSLLPKPITGMHIHKNAKLVNYAEIDLIVNINDVFLIVEAKRSVTKQMMRKGRDQVSRYCNCFRALYPDSRIIGFVYSPLGPKLISDVGNRSAWDPYFQPLFDTINYRGYKQPKKWNRRTLQSQSGTRSYMTSKKSDDLPMVEQKQGTVGGTPSIVVHAGVHHSARMRASKPSDSPWSMNNIFYDTNTIQSDLKYVKEKFADEQRDHFAAPGSTSCDSKQVTPIQGLLQEMKVSVPSADGFSIQEEVQTSTGSDDNIGV
jgi:hypothetical protein